MNLRSWSDAIFDYFLIIKIFFPSTIFVGIWNYCFLINIPFVLFGNTSRWCNNSQYDSRQKIDKQN
jgi:hypothetical protein